MEDLFKKMVVFIAKMFVIGIFTFVYATPLFWLFNLIFNQKIDLLDEISIKSYLITYCTLFVVVYIFISKETENTINKGS